MKSFLLIFFFSTALHAEIILPPDPGWKNNRNLMGIDSNNNNVRDDLEIFVYKEITKDEKLYRAYLNYLESKLMMMRYADNIQVVRKYYVQSMDDMICISSIKKIENEIIRLGERIYNTSLRRKKIRRIEEKWNDISVAYEIVNPDKRHLKCRLPQ